MKYFAKIFLFITFLLYPLRETVTRFSLFDFHIFILKSFTNQRKIKLRRLQIKVLIKFVKDYLIKQVFVLKSIKKFTFKNTMANKL
jgi:hypothetical protein